MTTINILMIAIVIIDIIIISRKMSSYRRTIRMTAAPPLAGGALKLQGEKKTFVISEPVRTFISSIIYPRNIILYHWAVKLFVTQATIFMATTAYRLKKNRLT